MIKTHLPFSTPFSTSFRQVIWKAPHVVDGHPKKLGRSPRRSRFVVVIDGGVAILFADCVTLRKVKGERREERRGEMVMAIAAIVPNPCT